MGCRNDPGAAPGCDGHRPAARCSSQADSEVADLARQKRELVEHPEHEQRELAAIYVKRGLPKALAIDVAEALTAYENFEAHARDELGIIEHSIARPVQAGLASATSFIMGRFALLVAVISEPDKNALLVLVAVTVVALAILGLAGAKAGGARVVPASTPPSLGGRTSMPHAKLRW